MTITITIQDPDRTVVLPCLRAVEAAATMLLDAMTAAGLDDPRWQTAGPLVSAAALRLRECLGTPVRGTCVSGVPVVREADFAVAARALFSRDARLVAPMAGRDFVRIAVKAGLALS
jgi:hypothetical protein